MKGLYYRLIVYLDNSDESDTYYNIAWYMVHNLEKIATVGISDLAKACFVSPATISRYCRALGYDNFPHLKQDCTYIKEIKLQSAALTKIPVTAMKEKPLIASNEYIKQINTAMSEMTDHLDYKAIDRVLNLIYSSNKTAFFGSQFSHSAALHLQADLLMLDKFTLAPIDYEKQMDISKQLDSDSVAIIFSINGNFFKSATKMLYYVKKSNCKVVLVTQNPPDGYEDFVDELIIMGDSKYCHVGKHLLLTLVELMSSRYNALFLNKRG